MRATPYAAFTLAAPTRVMTGRGGRARARATTPRPDRALERAVEEVTGAVLFVVDRPSSTIRICNLQDCRAAVTSVRPLADASGVELVLEQPAAGRGCDVIVRAR